MFIFMRIRPQWCIDANALLSQSNDALLFEDGTTITF